jgi:dTDP-4-amino-4,6-dideoxygalactose transaminase
MILVTKPFLPPREEFETYLDGIWQRNWLTNNGPLVNEFELKLKDYLKVKHLLYTTNGTIAIQLAIKALGLRGEIITTPFSYVATTSSIVWEGCTPVFVDIDSRTLNIDAAKIERAITSKTSAILATHVYGIPCDVEAIEDIARRHELKVIYDGAHAFGVSYKGRNIFEYGDVSTASFHATKLFHTIEGGAVFCQDPALLRTIALMRNFGHDGYDKYSGVGINGKNCELHAAMGLVNLRFVDEIILKRKTLCNLYDQVLQGLVKQAIVLPESTLYNFAYYPILLPSQELLLKMLNELNKHWIYPRRYFYPSLSELPYVAKHQDLLISDDISKRVICLPLYHTLEKEEIDMIARILLRVQNN